MRVVLLFPPFRLPGMYSLPPLGLISIGTVAKGAGHQVTIIDSVLGLQRQEFPLGPKLYDLISERILEHDPDVLGISCQCTTLPPSLNIAKRVKQKSPKTFIVLGGHNVGFQAEELLKNFSYVDLIIEGEGELSFLELLEALEGKKPIWKVQGLWWRDGLGIIYNGQRGLIQDLDSLPLPDYNLAPLPEEYQDAYGLRVPIAILETGRGCPHRCVYCSESIFWRQKVRRYSIDRCLKLIKELYEKYGVRYFLFAHDQFTSDKRYVETFCMELLKTGLKDISWYCISRLDTVDERLLALMAEAGLKSMCYGIDSGSERTLKFIKKGLNKKLLFQRVKETTNQNIIPTLSFVLGFPEESKEDIHKTLELAILCSAYSNVAPLMQIPTVLPGTELYIKYRGNLIKKIDSYFALGLEFDRGKRLKEDESLITDFPDIFCSFYNVPPKAISLEELDLIVKYFPLVLELYPKTFLLLNKTLNNYLQDLFLQFLYYVQTKRKYDRPMLTFKDTLFYIKGFLKESLAKFPHLQDILCYETYIGYARFLKNKKSFREKVGDMPVKGRGILVRAFDFDVLGLIMDAVEGRGIEPLRLKNFKVFYEKEGRVEVDDINEFGYDLLRLCDGKKDIDEIAASMWVKYGKSLSQESFRQEILRALEESVDLGYVSWSSQKRKEV